MTIAEVWAELPAETIAEGRAWYPAARAIAASLEPSNVPRAAAVLATLSPMRSWPQNARLARVAYALAAEGRVTDTPTMGDQRRKLARLFAGEAPLDVLGGDKVRAFYATIVDHSHSVAVIDRHAVAIVEGRPGNYPQPSGRKYDNYSDAYTLFAASIGEHVSTVQAATWIHWRRHYAQAFHGDM